MQRRHHPAGRGRLRLSMCAYDEDPLNYHGKVPARTLAEVAGALATIVPRALST